MKLDELLKRATDSFEAKLVYTEPYEKDGITVIAAARVSGGGGGGNGQDKNGQQGEGGGLGLTAKPVGAYVIKDGRLRWEPAIDVTRLMGTLGAVTIGILLAAARIVSVRTGARAGDVS